MGRMMETEYLGADPASARVVCVFVQSRTQTPEDMQAQVIRHLKTAGVAYVLPRSASKSWYDAKAVDALTDDTRAQLTASLDGLALLISAVRAETNAPPCWWAGLAKGPACQWNMCSGVASLTPLQP